MAEKIKALFVFEILGRPPEHIKKALGGFIDKLGEQKGIKIIRREIHKPKPVEAKEGQMGIQNLFTTFAEVELLADNLNLIFAITLNMLPAHVEVIEPKELSLKNFDLSSIISNLAVKIHRYDEIAKTLTMEKNILINRLKEALEKINNLEAGVKKPKEKKVKKKKTVKKRGRKRNKPNH